MVAQVWEQCVRAFYAAGESASVIERNLGVGAGLNFQSSVIDLISRLPISKRCDANGRCGEHSTRGDQEPSNACHPLWPCNMCCRRAGAPAAGQSWSGSRGERDSICAWRTVKRWACGRWTICGLWFWSPSSRRLPRPIRPIPRQEEGVIPTPTLRAGSAAGRTGFGASSARVLKACSYQTGSPTSHEPTLGWRKGCAHSSVKPPCGGRGSPWAGTSVTVRYALPCTKTVCA